MSASAIAAAASAFARCIRIGWCGVAPSGVIHTKCSAPTRSAARSRRQAASPLSSSTVARGWSRAPPARCTTASTPRSALRHEAGSARSPIASWTRTRSGPSRRGSRTRQRTGTPRATSRRTTAWPSNPVAPVSEKHSRSPAYATIVGHGLRDRRALHRNQGQLLRRGLPGRLHPPDARRAGLRHGRAALHRPGRVHRLRRLRRGVPGRRVLRRGSAPGRVVRRSPSATPTTSRANE